MTQTNFGYTIAIPAYGRPIEYQELLDSIFKMTKLPNEILICEDYSKERPLIKKITQQYQSVFNDKKVIVTYLENEVNLGYDANIRKLIDKAIFKWVILIGNDDLFVPNAIQILDAFVQQNPDISMVSRPFYRFNSNPNKPLGISRIFKNETILKIKDDPKFIFRSSGFVGGLVINKPWAMAIKTDIYDGSLFYQIYLSANAFCTNGIGYLSEPTVYARVGNPPMFGNTNNEGELHIPGSYSAKGRASMWLGVLKISKDIGLKYNVNLFKNIRTELMIQQSFHVFEMNVGVNKKILVELKNELTKIDLYNHFIPKSLFYINLFFGKYAFYFYYLMRTIKQ